MKAFRLELRMQKIYWNFG